MQHCLALISVQLTLLQVAAVVTDCRGDVACEAVLRNVLGSLTALAVRSERLTVAMCNAFHATLLRLSAAVTSGTLDCALQQASSTPTKRYVYICTTMTLLQALSHHSKALCMYQTQNGFGSYSVLTVMPCQGVAL
jgi:hypothetical protein